MSPDTIEQYDDPAPTTVAAGLLVLLLVVLFVLAWLAWRVPSNPAGAGAGPKTHVRANVAPSQKGK